MISQGVVAAGDVCVAEIIDNMSGANSSSVFQYQRINTRFRFQHIFE